VAPPRLSDEVVRIRAQQLVAQMTPDEKAGQLSQCFYFQALPPLARSVSEHMEKGGVGTLRRRAGRALLAESIRILDGCGAPDYRMLGSGARLE
jgi:hypothetical protein